MLVFKIKSIIYNIIPSFVLFLCNLSVNIFNQNLTAQCARAFYWARSYLHVQMQYIILNSTLLLRMIKNNVMAGGIPFTIYNGPLDTSHWHPPTNPLHDWQWHPSTLHIQSLTSHSSLAEEDWSSGHWHMPIESFQYFIILFRVNQVFTFYHFITMKCSKSKDNYY